MTFLHHYFEQIGKWADVNTGAFFSLFSAFFGSKVLLFIDPSIAKDAATIGAAVVSIVVGGVAGFVAIRRSLKDLKMIEKDLEKKDREAEQDEEAHLIDVISKLDSLGLIDKNLSLDEKLAIARTIKHSLK